LGCTAIKLKVEVIIDFEKFVDWFPFAIVSRTIESGLESSVVVTEVFGSKP